MRAWKASNSISLRVVKVRVGCCDNGLFESRVSDVSSPSRRRKRLDVGRGDAGVAADVVGVRRVGDQRRPGRVRDGRRVAVGVTAVDRLERTPEPVVLQPPAGDDRVGHRAVHDGEQPRGLAQGQRVCGEVLDQTHAVHDRWVPVEELGHLGLPGGPVGAGGGADVLDLLVVEGVRRAGDRVRPVDLDRPLHDQLVHEAEPRADERGGRRLPDARRRRPCRTRRCPGSGAGPRPGRPWPPRRRRRR